MVLNFFLFKISILSMHGSPSELQRRSGAVGSKVSLPLSSSDHYSMCSGAPALEETGEGTGTLYYLCTFSENLK
jgi:hypothetical protein